MSLMKKCFSSSKHCIFAFLIVISNLLFFQPTKAQLYNPFCGFTCDDDEACQWTNDSSQFISPGPDTNCKYTAYYKYRNCKGYLELQPTAVRHPGTTSCAGAMMFYGDTLQNQRMEQLLKTAEHDLVIKFFNEFISTLDSNRRKVYTSRILGDTMIVDSAYKLGFYRPACRGICISYGRPNSSSAINSVYGKWYNCSNQCCEIISYLAIDTINPITTITPQGFYNDSNYIRVKYERGVRTDTCTSSTPCYTCDLKSISTNVIRFKNCRNYCVDSAIGGGFGVYGPDHYDPFILPYFDKTKSGVFNLNEMPFISEKVFSAIPDNILLETANDIIVNVSSDVLAVKIVNVSGVVLQNIPMTVGKSFATIPIHSLQNGMYVLVFETLQGTSSKPLIISK